MIELFMQLRPSSTFGISNPETNQGFKYGDCIFPAILGGSLETVKLLVKDGIILWTAIKLAVLYGSDEILHFLIEHHNKIEKDPVIILEGKEKEDVLRAKLVSFEEVDKYFVAKKGSEIFSAASLSQDDMRRRGNLRSRRESATSSEELDRIDLSFSTYRSSKKKIDKIST
eukprot:TRINITY_DN4863_c0_g1_i3.p2 TRINITY_DN4863_c0_g1~~TRINITY_DN4863_c0_g1_i3.p2  ORF type:complete len:171 (-),score=31.60 TRINITY_DN4863_c0_g1_i3:85-597(-)